MKWSPISFGPLTFLALKKPWEIWASKSLGPTQKSYAFFGNRRYVVIFMQGPNFLGPKFLGDQTSWGQNLLRSKFVRDQKSQGSKRDWGPFQLQPLVAHLLNATYLVCTSWCMLNPCCLICLSVLKYSCFLSGFKLLHFFVKPSYLVAE